jgi:hypothetical protein
MMDLKKRFIEDDPETLQWSSEPISSEEKKLAEEMFKWIGQN